MPTRGNPFEMNRELRDVARSVPPPPTAPEIFPPTHGVYQEINPPKPRTRVSEDEGEGPPIPPMRVSGFVQGAQLSAILQIGNGTSAVFERAVPGKVIKYGDLTYTVERLEPERVVLVNRWEIGDRSGVQRIEVTMTGSGRSG